MRILVAGALMLMALGGSAFAQGRGFVTTDVNLRAGPSVEYPVVLVLAEGSPLDIFGCLEDYSWCDVAVDDYRGWVAAQYVESVYQGRRVEFYEYAPVIGVPIVGFTFGDYWGRYYRGRPWYATYDRWGPPRRPPVWGPPGWAPPPKPGWGKPGWGGPGWGGPPPPKPGWGGPPPHGGGRPGWNGNPGWNGGRPPQDGRPPQQGGPPPQQGGRPPQWQRPPQQGQMPPQSPPPQTTRPPQGPVPYDTSRWRGQTASPFQRPQQPQNPAYGARPNCAPNTPGCPIPPR